MRTDNRVQYRQNIKELRASGYACERNAHIQADEGRGRRHMSRGRQTTGSDGYSEASRVWRSVSSPLRVYVASVGAWAIAYISPSPSAPPGIV